MTYIYIYIYNYTVAMPPSMLKLTYVNTYCEHPKLDEIGIKNGPVLWVDIADKNVCVGSVGTLAWSLEVRFY